MIQKLFLVFTSLIIGSQLFAQTEIDAKEKTPLTIGETIEFKSEVLNEDRILNVYLPLGYSPDSLKKYPVIYLLDGSMDGDFLHIVGLTQFCSFFWLNIMPESIVVGIANTDRKRDFTHPSKNKELKKKYPSSGGSKSFIDFIGTEVQPLIDKHYKTNSTKTIIGQSLGGLLASEILLRKPDLFDNYIIISPSLWWGDESLLKTKAISSSSPKSIYIAVGKEGEMMERVAKELHEKLKSTQNEKTNLFFQFLEKQDHANILHVAAHQAFERIFKTVEIEN